MNINNSVIQTMKPRSLFLKYLLPSLFGMLLMALNILIDGLFVSHGVGADALAGVNIAVPIYSVILSISLWIGMGGATLYSIALGEKNYHQAQNVFNHSLWLTLIITGILVFFCLLFEKPITYLFGANDLIINHATNYLHVILLFGLIFVLENILSIFIRNDGNPILAMMGLVTTAVVNIGLNYLFIFVFQWGVKGAAYATVISTILGTLVLLTHFIKPKTSLIFRKTKLHYQTMKEILIIGLPSFVVEASIALTAILFNITFNHFTGNIGITAYAVINYMHIVFLMLFIGIGAALQPITSYLCGSQLYERMKIFIYFSIITTILLSTAILLLGLIGNDLILQLFGITDPLVLTYARLGIQYFFLGYLFLGINMVILEFYQSIGQMGKAMAIVIARSVIFFIPLLWILPIYFGGNSIWLAFPIAEGLTLLVMIIAIRFKWVQLIPALNP